MPGKYTIEKHADVSIVRYAANPTVDDFRTAVETIAQEGPCQRRLWDVSKGIDFNFTELKEIAEFAKNAFPTTSRVAIVAKDAHTHGLSRIEDSFRQDGLVDQQIFRSEADALLWLQSEDEAGLE